jgi:hypothetical protein
MDAASMSGSEWCGYLCAVAFSIGPCPIHPPIRHASSPIFLVVPIRKFPYLDWSHRPGASEQRHANSDQGLAGRNLKTNH